MKFFIIIAFLFFYNYSDAQNNYCIPTPTNGVNGHSITKITLESLDTSFTGDVYQFIPDSVYHETCYLTPGSSYQISLKSGTHTTSTLAAWIDWNNDTTLGQSEKLGEFITSSSGQLANISFTVPQNCYKGKLRLRIRASSSTGINACSSYSSGQIIDFTITTLNPFYEYNFYPGWEFSGTGSYYIDGVSIGSIDNNKTGGVDGPVFGDYSNLTTNVIACNNYYIKVTGNFSPDPNFITAFVDFNKNGLFEEVELLSTISVPAGINTDSILFIPQSVTGICRLRIIYSSNLQIVEVEEYSVNILSNSTTSYPAALIGSDLYFNCDSGCYYYGCIGSNTFHDYSCGVPTGRLWTVTGGASPSTSTSRNPTFIFPNPGVYNITLEVSNSEGSDIIAAQIYIKSPVTSFNLGSNTDLCTGDSMLLSAPTGSCFSYQWSNGATSRQIYARSSGTYSVEVTSCHYYNCPAYDTIVVNFTPNVYTVTGGGNYCTGGSGSSVGLNDSQTGVAYQLFKDGLPIGSSIPGTGSAISFGLQSAAGVYTIKATSASPVCTRSMTGSKTINVIPLPTAFTVNGGGTYCTGSGGLSVGLTDSEINVAYQLYRNGIIIGNPIAGTGAAINFPSHSTAGNYTVVATGNNSSCTTTMTGSANISPIPAPQVFSVSGGGTFCGGTAISKVVLNDSHVGDTYELIRNGIPTGIMLNGNDSALVFSHLMQSGTYTIAASDSSSCRSTMSGSATLNIRTTPYPFALTGGGNFCNDLSLDSIKLSGSETWVRYQLYLDSLPVGNSLNGNGSSLNFGMQTNPGTYIVIGSHTLTGCYLSMNGHPSISLSQGAPFNNVTGGGHYCTGGLGLAIGLNGSDTAFNYQLFHNGNPSGSPVSGTGTSLDFGFKNAAGNYTVVAFANDSTCTTNMNDTATIVIDPLPSPNITSPLPDTMCTFSSPIALTGTPPGGIFSGDGVLHDTLFPSLAGPQTVFVYYDYSDPVTGCSTYASDIVLIDVCNTIEENQFSNSFMIFPNPANDEFITEFTTKNAINFSIELINETGKIVQRKHFKNSRGIFSHRFNISSLSNGIYLVKISFDNSSICKKLIVTHD